MARTKLTREIVKARYPLYDANLKALIAKVYAVHRGEAEVEYRMVAKIWDKYSDEFDSHNIEASKADAIMFEAAQRGELTDLGRDAIIVYIDEAQQYDESLWVLSDAELKALHDRLCSAMLADRQAYRHERGMQADVLAFFNLYESDANFAHWCALPIWSREEAIALSLGKDPKCVNVASLRAYSCLHGSPFREEFFLRLDALERALVDSKNSLELMQPKRFLQWLKDSHYKYPEQLDVLQTVLRSKQDNFDTRNIHTMYKILLGLAIKHYDYDPTLDKGDIQPGVFAKMEKDLTSVDAFTTAKTLRTTLHEASAWALIEPHPLIGRIRRNNRLADQKSKRKP